MKLRLLMGALGMFAVGCNDVEGDGHDDGHENEVITTVVLSFAPSGGGAALAFTWADPEDDGSPVIDDVTLAASEDYTLTVTLLNELESPAEDLTAEVADEADEHQLFFTGSAVSGPASSSASAVLTHAYNDEDEGGLPVGLENTITTDGAGSGTLMVTLRHLPPEGGTAAKVAGLAEAVEASGFGAIAGDNDAQVEFPVTVE